MFEVEAAQSGVLEHIVRDNIGVKSRGPIAILPSTKNT